jgi:hypothetical protein
MKSLLFVFSCLILSCSLSSAQNTGFAHAQGNRILDNEGNNIVFRGIGTGNWMIQEGYMMGTSGATNGTMWHFRQKLTSTIGKERTDEFFDKWYDCHFSKVDVDSMKAWGFNSVRPALHYKVFTLPVEDEPVAGQDTWFEEGFVRLDSLMSWCAQNRMYCILDMHGCPGAQGSDSNISDYDQSKPSLWESEANKRKLVALWRKIAKRYADNPWIGAYDLINEPKWDALQANRNTDLWDLLKRIITAVREVDRNHLCFLAGNSWGNDYTGLPDLSTWGGNIGLSFHKYWNYNEEGAIDWIVNRGNSLNVPVWLGETGENSNSWFTDCIRICESKNVGWAFWPVKKMGGNNILRVKGANSSYTAMLNAWRNNSSINATTAYNGVMQFAEDHRFENCRIQYDVIDAMITRPHSNEARPSKNHDISKEIFGVDYDFGPVNVAYFDKVDADYHSASGTYTSWNSGGQYRNDGVDIQTSSDNVSNGYSVGWIEDGEWLHYTLPVPESKIYNVQFRYSSQAGGARVYLEVNGVRASRTVDLAATGSWTTWGTAVIPSVLFPAGDAKVKVVFEKAGCNFNWFKLVSPQDAATQKFEVLNAETDRARNQIKLFFNQGLKTAETSSFTVKVDEAPVAVTAVKTIGPQEIELNIDKNILNGNDIKISYAQTNCTSVADKPLEAFANRTVDNKIVPHAVLPAKVEAENYAENNGFEFQDCSDTGGGQNAGYTNAGDYLEYVVYSGYTGKYSIDLRVAVNVNTALVSVQRVDENNTLNVLKNVRMSNTGGWQAWRTQGDTINLRQGKNILRLTAVTEGYNLNWFEIKEVPGEATKIATIAGRSVWEVFPNPVKSTLHIQSSEALGVSAGLFLYNPAGQLLLSETFRDSSPCVIDMSRFSEGLYILKIASDNSMTLRKINHIN